MTDVLHDALDDIDVPEFLRDQIIALMLLQLWMEGVDKEIEGEGEKGEDFARYKTTLIHWALAGIANCIKAQALIASNDLARFSILQEGFASLLAIADPESGICPKAVLALHGQVLHHVWKDSASFLPPKNPWGGV